MTQLPDPYIDHVNSLNYEYSSWIQALLVDSIKGLAQLS